jgi:hypothetical protein
MGMDNLDPRNQASGYQKSWPLEAYEMKIVSQFILFRPDS